MYIERHLSETIENLDPTRMTAAEFEELVKICAPHTVRLTVGQILTRVDLQKLISTLNRLVELRVTFTVRKVGMDFDWSLFGMRLEDTQQIAAGLRVTQSLAALSLPRCMINDDGVRALSEGIAANATLTLIGAWRCMVVLFCLSVVSGCVSLYDAVVLIDCVGCRSVTQQNHG